MSAWLNALSAYAAATRSAPSSLAARRQLYDTVAAAHLPAATAWSQRGARSDPRGLAVLRQLRWNLMREGSPGSRSVLLEHILALYARASQSYSHEDSNPLASPASQQQQQQPVTMRMSLSSREQQGLLLEQLQCLVDAKASGVPLTASHYRHVLSASTQLAQLDPQLPLALLQDLTAHRENSSSCFQKNERRRLRDREELMAMQDCCVALASAGHVTLALELCQHMSFILAESLTTNCEGSSSSPQSVQDGKEEMVATSTPLLTPEEVRHVFPCIIDRVYHSRREGWRQAWQLADAVPLSLLLPPPRPPPSACPTSSPSQRPVGHDIGWLEGFVAAALHRCRAEVATAATGMTPPPLPTSGHRDTDVHATLGKFIEHFEKQNSTTAATDRSDGITALHTAGASRRPPRFLLEAYVTSCPSHAWRDALAFLGKWNYGSASSHGGDVELARNEKDAGIRVGRVMAVLLAAQQPVEALKLLYGDNVFATAGSQTTSTSVDDHQQEENGSSSGDENAQGHRVHHQGELVLNETMVLAQCTKPLGPLLTNADRQHPAIFNYAMAAFGALGKWHLAIQIYDARSRGRENSSAGDGSGSPQRLHNDFSHLTIASMVLRQPTIQTQLQHTNSSPMPLNDHTYALCARALMALSDPSADRDGLGESLILWAGCRLDCALQQQLLHHFDAEARGWRYAHVAALATACVAAASNVEHLPLQKESAAAAAAAQDIPSLLISVCSSPTCSVKQVCLAVTVVASVSAALDCCSDSRTSTLPPSGDGGEGILSEAMCNIVVESLARVIGTSQPAMDDVICHFAEYLQSTRRHQALPRPDEFMCDLERRHLLGSTMDLLRGTSNNEEGWKVIRQVIAALGERLGLSTQKAAPAMISAGISGEVALHFLMD